MRRSLIVFAAAVLVLMSLGGCRFKKAFDAAQISKDLDNKGTIDLMKEAEKDQYTPPADGRLTDQQVKMYLKVRDHEKDIVKVARAEAEKHAEEAKKSGENSVSGMMEGFKTLGSVADIATADIRAAKDLGYNTKEYMWVKEQVLKASTAAFTEKTSQAMSAMMDSSYQQLKKSMDDAKDEQQKKMYADMLANMEKSKTEMKPEAVDPATEYNRELLKKYGQELNALTAEMSKWENKEGEAKQGMDQWQKQLDDAAAKAKEGQK